MSPARRPGRCRSPARPISLRRWRRRWRGRRGWSLWAAPTPAVTLGPQNLAAVAMPPSDKLGPELLGVAPDIVRALAEDRLEDRSMHGFRPIAVLYRHL